MTGVSAELCIQARQLGLLGEAVAAEQILSERQAQASQRLTDAAAHGSAVGYTAAVATAQAAAVQALVMSQAADVFTKRCRDAAAALATAAAEGSWLVFEASRETAAALGQALTEAETQMQVRRAGASEAISSALQLVLSELQLEAWHSTGVMVKQQGRPQSAMHCTDCSSSLPQMQAACAVHGVSPAPYAGRVTRHSMWVMSAELTPLDVLNEQVKDLTVQMIDALPSSDSNNAAWQRAVTVLVEVLQANQRRHTDLNQIISASRTSEGAAQLSAAVCNARHVGMLQTAQLALQVLQKHIQVAQQAQQAAVTFNMPTAQHVQDNTHAWEQQSLPAANAGMPTPQHVASTQPLRTAVHLHGAVPEESGHLHAGAAVRSPAEAQVGHPWPVPGHQQSQGHGSNPEGTQELVQQLCQGVKC